MAPVPLAKLVGLLIKTLAKPVSKQIRNQFVKQPLTRRGLVWVGQTSHAVTTRMTIYSSGFKVRSIPEIEEEAALKQGAELLSEAFLFAVSGGLVMYEYNRSSAKDKEKEAARHQALRDDAARLQAKLVSLDKRLEALEEYAQKNRRSILGIGIGNAAEYVTPGGIVPIVDEEEGGSGAASIEDKGTQPRHEPSAERTPNAAMQTRRWWWPF